MGDPTQEKSKTFPKGQVILKEGQQSNVAYMVKKGTVTIFRVVNNRKVVLGKMKPGQIFGESAIITGEPFHANAVADDFVELLVIDQTMLKTLLLKCPNPIQRIVRYLMDRVCTLEKVVRDQPSTDTFLSICQVLELQYQVAAARQKQNGEAKKTTPAEVSYVDFSRTVRNMLLVTQLEIDTVIDKLSRLGVVTVSEIKNATYRTDILGQSTKSTEYVQDKNIYLKDPENFITVAKNMSKDMVVDDTKPYTECLDFIDMADLAEMVKSSPEILYKKLAQQEIPESLFFFPHDAMKAWAQIKGEDFFQRAKRKRLNIDEIETVDDLVFVDANTLRDVFQKIGFHKVLVLYAGAQEEARAKFLSCMSKKIAAMVQEEGEGRQVDDMELADLEGEAIDLVRSLKGIPAKGK